MDTPSYGGAWAHLKKECKQCLINKYLDREAYVYMVCAYPFHIPHPSSQQPPHPNVPPFHFQSRFSHSYINFHRLFLGLILPFILLLLLLPLLLLLLLRGEATRVLRLATSRKVAVTLQPVTRVCATALFPLFMKS